MVFSTIWVHGDDEDIFQASSLKEPRRMGRIGCSVLGTSCSDCTWDYITPLTSRIVNQLTAILHQPQKMKQNVKWDI